MKKTLTLLALSLLVAGITGCGSGSDDASGKPPPSNASTMKPGAGVNPAGGGGSPAPKSAPSPTNQ